MRQGGEQRTRHEMRSTRSVDCCARVPLVAVSVVAVVVALGNSLLLLLLLFACLGQKFVAIAGNGKGHSTDKMDDAQF